MKQALPFFFLLFIMAGCQREHPAIVDPYRPHRAMQDYFDKKYLLYRLPADYYNNQSLGHSFTGSGNSTDIKFLPLGYEDSLHLQYSHVYSKDCVYHTADSVWKFAEVCFPNTCLTKDKVYAKVTLTNTTSQVKTYYLRLFYQNTTYWYPTDSSIDFVSQNYLDNYYGASEIVEATVPAGKSSVVYVPYSIGMNPKHEYDLNPSQDPARTGNYEFILLTQSTRDNLLMDQNLDLKKVNPFAEVKRDEIQNGGRKYFNQIDYVAPSHFKFVFLDEYFDGVNDLTPNHIYAPKDSSEKKLCDTCSGWYRGVISENWNCNDYFTGYISKAPFVKADYGNRKENFLIDKNGITLTCPKSERGNYKKTWGEFIFGPAFKYGHLTVRAKFDEMLNKESTPNGIVHNLWLYQRNYDKVDTTNPYHSLVDANGSQPFEIDFEVWSSTLYNEGTVWNRNALINYSIVDYMRDANVKLKPGEEKPFGNFKIERYNKRQASVIGQEMGDLFFRDWHTYELYWYPDHVRFLLDGVETADITKDAAKIPDKYLYLWIGCPIYQDGTWYAQSGVPFLKRDKKSVIDYIRIE